MVSRLPYLTAVLLATASTSPAAAQRAIILVRHAEKAAGVGDVPLAPAGKTRADNLATRLKDAGVTAIYTSEALRTKETAAPTGAALHLMAEARPAGESADDFKTHLAMKNPDDIVLVVGHADTVPAIVNAFVGAGTVSQIPETDFGQLFMLIPKGDGKWGLVRASY